MLSIYKPATTWLEGIPYLFSASMCLEFDQCECATP